jgi:hypothetical protein
MRGVLPMVRPQTCKEVQGLKILQDETASILKQVVGYVLKPLTYAAMSLKMTTPVEIKNQIIPS